MDVSILFRRTPSGVAEIELNHHGLGTRERQLLVLINGTRTVADLSLLIPAIGDVRPMLLELLAKGFITTTSQTSMAATASAEPPAPGPGTLPAPPPALPPTAAPQPLAQPAAPAPAPAPAPTPAPAPAPAQPNAAPTQPAAAPDGPSPEALDAAKHHILQLVHGIFGEDAGPMAGKIQACDSLTDLHSLAARLGGIIVTYAGNGAAENFRVRAEDILAQAR